MSLGLALLWSACGPVGPGPVSERLDGIATPTVEIESDIRHVRNEGAGERLFVYRELPERNVRLLFLDGRAATPTSSGGSAWADMDGGRVVLFDRDGVVERVLTGRPAEGPPLAQPAFVAVQGDAVLAVEGDGRALSFGDGEPDRWLPAAPSAFVGGGGRPVAAARTLFDIDLLPLAPGGPLIWGGADLRSLRPVGEIRMPDQAMLAPVANSGWVAPLEDGSIVFASAVRPELLLFDASGELRWRSSWPHAGAIEPRFGISEGTLVPRFELVAQAVVEGPDGLIYVLSTPGRERADPDSDADRVSSIAASPERDLLVFDREGVLLRRGGVEAEAAVYVGRRGHVYATDPSDAYARTESVASSPPFEPFDLPDLTGDGRIRLEEHRGKVVVVNFWASWCAPCRQEMPALDDLASRLDPTSAIVIGLNEDARPADARAFLDRLGGVGYRIALGGGELKSRYGYRGLPYTVVVDPQGRVAKAFYGFGTSIVPIERAVDEAVEAAVDR